MPSEILQFPLHVSSDKIHSLKTKKTNNCTVINRVLHCHEWTSSTVKRENELDSDWLIFQEKSEGDSQGSARSCFSCAFIRENKKDL